MNQWSSQQTSNYHRDNVCKQWYVNFPSALAQAMEFAKSEVVEWIIRDKDTLVLQRKAKKAQPRKKKQ